MALSKLSQRKVDTAPTGKHEDGGGLRLVVTPAKTRRWVFRYTFASKRKEKSLGHYPSVSLARAREKAALARELLSEGVDPKNHALDGRALVKDRPFISYAAQYIRLNRRQWKGKKTAKNWCYTLRKYAFPVIGDKPIRLITKDDIVKILLPIWTSHEDVPKRLQRRICEVINLAIADCPMNLKGYKNPAEWKDNLDKLMPKKAQRPKDETHYPSMPFELVPAFWKELRKMESRSSLAMQLLILTCARTQEVLGMQWSEVDMEQAVWEIPPERMKTGVRHRIPLTEPVMAILRKRHQGKRTDLVFPTQYKPEQMSNNAFLALMHRMGYSKQGGGGHYVPHGFRSSFRDWCSETTPFPDRLAEMSLSHVVDNEVEAAYRRRDMLSKRRVLLEAWARYVTTGNSGVLNVGAEDFDFHVLSDPRVLSLVQQVTNELKKGA